VKAVFEAFGLKFVGSARPGDNGVRAIFRYAKDHGHVFETGLPFPGDLVFFSETYDVNRDGLKNDGLSHIGIVETVEADGLVQVLHRTARGVVRSRMNLSQRQTHKSKETNEIVNDYLRSAAPGSKGRLMSQLFTSFASVLEELEGDALESPRDEAGLQAEAQL
jgi:peptidoglycan DL-endopeptidase CwlO